MKLIKDKNQARRIITRTWFIFLLINLSMLLYLRFDDWIAQDNFIATLKVINSTYSPYLIAILTFYFASSQKTSKDDYKIKKTGALEVAFFGMLMWNLFVTLMIALPVFKIGSIESSIENIEIISQLFSWLVSGSMAYFFAKSID